ncbi:hypothetical protein KIN20_016459, partial [Parelaphostrongylus tenuis]
IVSSNALERKRPRRLPNSTRMNLLNYDCELERTAYNIAQSCPDNSNPSFDYTGSNNYTGELLYEGYYASFVLRAYWSWYSTWEANKNETPLEDLKPTNKNAPMIPFLQTMVGNMTKLGCAFNLNCINSTTAPLCPLLSIWRAARQTWHSNLHEWHTMLRMS